MIKMFGHIKAYSHLKKALRDYGCSHCERDEVVRIMKALGWVEGKGIVLLARDVRE